MKLFHEVTQRTKNLQKKTGLGLDYIQKMGVLHNKTIANEEMEIKTAEKKIAK